MKAKRIPFITASLFTFAVLAAAVVLQPGNSKTPALPVLGAVPDFFLYDSSAKEFKLENLKGKVFIADFIFTTCSGICPMMTKNMMGVYNAFKGNDSVRFVSISVNPEYDSPAVLADYAKKLNISGRQWHFLTGSREEISRLAISGFKIGSVDEPVFHSGYLVLVDGKSQIRGYYDGTKPALVRKLIEDIPLLLKEK